MNIETKGEGNKEFLQIIDLAQGNKKVLESISALSTGLYHAKVSMIEANATFNKEAINNFTLWHDRLGHPGSTMMRKLILNSNGHFIKEKIMIPKHLSCVPCSQSH